MHHMHMPTIIFAVIFLLSYIAKGICYIMHSCHSDQNVKYTRTQIIIVMFLQSNNKTMHSCNFYSIIIHIMQACKKKDTFPPIRKSSARSWNCPWISPHIVTGHLTGCLAFSSPMLGYRTYTCIHTGTSTYVRSAR